MLHVTTLLGFFHAHTHKHTGPRTSPTAPRTFHQISGFGELLLIEEYQIVTAGVDELAFGTTRRKTSACYNPVERRYLHGGDSIVKEYVLALDPSIAKGYSLTRVGSRSCTDSGVEGPKEGAEREMRKASRPGRTCVEYGALMLEGRRGA